MIFQRRFIVLFIGIFLMIGCATASEWPQLSGFLKDYKGMYRSNTVRGLFLYERPDQDFTHYTKFIIEPISVIYSKGQPAAGPQESKILSQKFRENLINTLNESYTIVDHPANDVLRIRTAISNIQSGTFSWMSGGTIEMELLDSLSNKRMIALVQERKGSDFQQWPRVLKDQLDSYRRKKVIYKY